MSQLGSQSRSNIIDERTHRITRMMNALEELEVTSIVFRMQCRAPGHFVLVDWHCYKADGSEKEFHIFTLNTYRNELLDRLEENNLDLTQTWKKWNLVTDEVVVFS